MKDKEIIIVSGINFFEGGPLTIMTEALEVLNTHFTSQFKIIALVHAKNLYKAENIEFIEFSKSRKSWFYRLYYEYFYFRKLSKKLQPTYWISMHDITPNVICKDQFVYCHNPAPFFKPSATDVKYGFTTFLFSLFYKFLYKKNIKKNKSVIVQQNWLRKEFLNTFNIKNVIVAHPKTTEKKRFSVIKKFKNDNVVRLFYPSFPRSFKNFEVICKAYKKLPLAVQKKLEIYLTIDSSMNRYAKAIVHKYSEYNGLKFIGLQSREEVYEYYNSVDGLVFPSRLETWGLPISEFKQFNKPIIVADLPYAYETIGTYEKAVFFEPNNSNDLSLIFEKLTLSSLEFKKIKVKKIEQPFVTGWLNLFNLILNVKSN